MQTRILQAIFECKQHKKEKEFGTVECCYRCGVLESAELECRWSGRRLYRYFPVADFNARRLGCVVVARMFQKTGWSERWYSRIVHAIRTLVRIAMSGGYRQSEMERTIECRECGKMDCGRAAWTVDPHFSTLVSQRKKTGRIRGCFDGNSRILEWETQTTCDLGWRLQCELVRHDRLSLSGGVDPETKNVGRHKRFIASESFTHDGDRTGFDGDKHVDECRHRTRAFHAFQLVKPRRLVDRNGLHHDFEKTGHGTSSGPGFRLVQDRSQSGVCSSFVETENEVHDEECCKLAWLGARRLLARYGYSNADGLEELEQIGTFACGNSDGSQKVRNQRDVRDRTGAQNTSVEKEENRTEPRAVRIGLALSKNLEKEKSIETREASGQDQGECRDGESPPRKRRASIST